MPNVSSITIAGHLGRDAETKNVGSTTVTEWSMAVTDKKKGQEETMWFRCALWGKRGESVAPYLTKGTPVLVIGAFRVREYEGKNGPGYSLEVEAHEMSFLGKSDKSDEAPARPAPAVDDSDVPF